jgi:hypothetical protein
MKSSALTKIQCPESGLLLALIIRSSFNSDGIEFFTPPDFSQQLGYMKRPKNYIVQPHIHNPVSREVLYTKEVLYIKSGAVLASFYTESQDYVTSENLLAGDIILLARGGHGFKMLEETEIIEVKQGPYAGDHDKTHFKPLK